MSTIIVDKFKAARRAGVPLLAINTADPIYLLSRLTGAAENGTETPLIRWDCVKGWVAVNGAGDIAIRNVFQKAIAEQRLATPEAVERFIQKMTTNGTESLTWAEELPERSILFYINPQRFLRESSQGVAGFSQAIANLRDPFKESQRTLVLAGTGVTTLPAELQSDVLSLDDPLPTAEELQGVLETLITGNELEIEPESIAKGVDALRGLAPFAAEQAAAMSLERTGIKLDELWERKRKMIEQTPGLQVWKGGEKFEDIAGIVNAKLYARAILAGRSAPKVIVFIDEIEKAFAGATKGTGDSSGVSQAFLGTMLKHMQDRKSKGVVCIGPPGAAKSAFAKAIGNEAGILTVAFDLTAMKNSLVGSSEGNLARALDVVDAVGDGNAMFVATCNKIADLPPELKRRFKRGTFFFDLPDAQEREAIWMLYRTKYNIKETEAGVNDTDWTGAEIEQCCETAYDLGWSLKAAAEFVVPVALSAADQIAELRQMANGVFISASYSGVYKGAAFTPKATEKRARKIA
jgi:hypothetical protein